MESKSSKYIVSNERPLSIIARDYLLTLAMWILWGYIMYPLFSLILWWLFDIDIFYYYDSKTGIESLNETLKEFSIYALLIIVSTSLLLVVWGAYNKERFKEKRNRRKSSGLRVDSKTVADSLKVKEDDISECKDARYIQIHHTDKPTDEDLFKKFNDDKIPDVKLYFCSDWDRVREESGFGTTYLKKRTV